MDPHPRNLIFDPFKNGDEFDDIFSTTSNGLDDTSMPAFGNWLSEEDRKNVAAFIYSLRKQKTSGLYILCHYKIKLSENLIKKFRSFVSISMNS